MQRLLNNCIYNIKNSQKLFLLECCIGNSKLNNLFLRCLYNEGFIRGFLLVDKNKIKVFLKYFKGFPVINNIQVVSKVNKRIYISREELFKLKKKKEIYIIKTQNGFFSSRHLFDENLMGGEVICSIF